MHVALCIAMDTSYGIVLGPRWQLPLGRTGPRGGSLSISTTARWAWAALSRGAHSRQKSTCCQRTGHTVLIRVCVAPVRFCFHIRSESAQSIGLPGTRVQLVQYCMLRARVLYAVLYVYAGTRLCGGRNTNFSYLTRTVHVNNFGTVSVIGV